MKILQIRTVLATIFLSLCIGQVYAWSLLSSHVTAVLNHDMSFAFSLAILFLGLSAAFMGKFVEKNPKKAYVMSVVLFASGFMLSGLACHIHSVTLFYISYGFLFGCSCGLGYVAPIKTLMLYFRHNKAVASVIAILSFGLAKSFSSPLYTYLTSNFSIDNAFYILTGIYLIPLVICAFLFCKFPVNYMAKNVETVKLKNIAFTLPYISTWLFFFLNIACGLAFISQEAQLYKHLGVEIGLATVFCTLSAVFNAGGRFGFAWISDHTNRWFPYVIVFALSALICMGSIFFPSTIMFVIMIMILNMNYGGGFSLLPSFIADKYGINNTSTIHSFTLSGWGFAGIAALFLKHLDINVLLPVCVLLYTINIGLLYIGSRHERNMVSDQD